MEDPPVESAPVESTPVVSAPVESASVESAPVEGVACERDVGNFNYLQWTRCLHKQIYIHYHQRR